MDKQVGSTIIENLKPMISKNGKNWIEPSFQFDFTPMNGHAKLSLSNINPFRFIRFISTNDLNIPFFVCEIFPILENKF